MTPEREMLEDVERSMESLAVGVSESIELLGPCPQTITDLNGLDKIQRTAARAMLKAVEQLQDIIARALRTVLVVEQEDLTGLTARAIADRAESVGLIENADAWSEIVKLRNRLVHDYPLDQADQLDRIIRAWDAAFRLLAMTASITSFIEQRRSDD